MDSDGQPLPGTRLPTRQCSISAFPLVRRVGKVRDVARKMLTKHTERHTVTYRDQVTAALVRHLDRLGVPERVRHEQLDAFWQAVRAEMIRQTYCGHGTGGAA